MYAVAAFNYATVGKSKSRCCYCIDWPLFLYEVYVLRGPFDRDSTVYYEGTLGGKLIASVNFLLNLFADVFAILLFDLRTIPVKQKAIRFSKLEEHNR